MRLIATCLAISLALAGMSPCAAVDHERAQRYFDVGRACLDKKDWQSAVKSFDKALKLDPNYASALINRGNAKSELGNNKGAIKDYNLALMIDPRNAPAYNNRGTVKEALKDFDGAISDYKSAAEIDAKFTTPRGNLGYLYSRQDKSELAINAFTQAIESDPKNFKYFAARAWEWSLLDFPTRAIEDYSTAIRLSNNKDAISYCDRAQIEHDMGQSDKARSDFEKAISLDPNNPHYHSYLALSLRRLHQPELALTEVNKAIQLAPRNPYSISQRGDIELELKDLDNALRDYNRSIELKPSEPRFLNNRGNYWFDLHKLDLAKADFEQALMLNPSYRLSMTDLGFTHLKLGNYNDCLCCFEKRAEQLPDQSSSYWLRGLARYYVHDYRGALQDQNTAIQMGCNYAPLYFQRAMTEVALGYISEAIKDYRQACLLDSQYRNNQIKGLYLVGDNDTMSMLISILAGHVENVCDKIRPMLELCADTTSLTKVR